ncbi:hypothetical protein [Cryptosporangium arvum]|nr:hypothetical protein [Cryptosporangium arvum]
MDRRASFLAAIAELRAEGRGAETDRTEIGGGPRAARTSVASRSGTG